MANTYRPLTRRQRADLAGYVSPLVSAFRAALFVAAVAIVGGVFRGIHRALTHDRLSLADDAWWAIPTLVFAVALFRRAGRWTGGREKRRRIRADLARGEMAVRRIVATDAIEIEEAGDAGPAYFILTAEGATIVFAGQYLERLKRKGFPWTAFDILEAPTSGIFFDIQSAGDRLQPSATRPPLTWDEMKAFGTTHLNYVTIDVDFSTLLRSAVPRDGDGR